MFLRFYDRPGITLPPHDQVQLRADLLEVAQTAFDPVPDYQCLSSDANALQDKLIVVAYVEVDETKKPKPIAFASALFLDVPDVTIQHAVLDTGLSVAIPSARRTGILAQLFVELYANVLPHHPRGIWVVTLAAVISSLVQAEKSLDNTFPSSSGHGTPAAEHLAIARTVNARYRPTLLISPRATWDEEHFVFRGSIESQGPTAGFLKSPEDTRYWHRDKGASEYFRGLLGEGDEVLLVGFMDWKRFEAGKAGMKSKL
ncbi:hypothetical protein C8F01DRAFT_1147564 [Mycena amicta]|nr:hypothetical protein C8F01DRAFT_1147564 [Mycena amicta]